MTITVKSIVGGISETFDDIDSNSRIKSLRKVVKERFAIKDRPRCEYK
jgi:hypothetical protein